MVVSVVVVSAVVASVADVTFGTKYLDVVEPEPPDEAQAVRSRAATDMQMILFIKSPLFR